MDETPEKDWNFHEAAEEAGAFFLELAGVVWAFFLLSLPVKLLLWMFS